MTTLPYNSSRSHGHSSTHHHHHHGPAAPTSSTHPGTFASGTKVQVGSHRVVVDKYLSEGGFAHVYVVRVPAQKLASGEHIKPTNGELAVLKRVAVPDKETLANMRTEVETMKKLKGHRHIVTYIDSHASQLKGGGYEVFLLMEYCAGGGLIDFMNTRLQHRLTEPEILHIFADVAEGVAAMHYLDPPLLHRDLKVENILISSLGAGKKMYKLCDFGSSAAPRPAATTAAEGRLIEEDIMKHTTMQYRSPEMIDVYRKQPINEKSDVWALGVLLYKLCYYTTPFEEQGQMAILNATYKYPSYPSFSDRLKRLIATMLKENPQSRPNIYQVICEVCSMRGTQVSIKDIYTGKSISESKRKEKLSERIQDDKNNTNSNSNTVVGLSKADPIQTKAAPLPDITPMRRGRPKQTQAEPTIVSKSKSSDPFAALDSQNQAVRSSAIDELSQKYPSLDQFSLLHDQGKNYEFTSSTSRKISENSDDQRLQKKVTEALADEAFARPISSQKLAAPKTSTLPSRTSSKSSHEIPIPIPRSHPEEFSTNMVSTGVQTLPIPTPSPQPNDVSSKPIWRVPSKSPHTISNSPDLNQSELPPRPEPSKRHFFERKKSRSQVSLESKPPLDVSNAPTTDTNLNDQARSVSKTRVSGNYTESNLDFLRDQEISPPKKDSNTPKTKSSSRPSSSHDSDLDKNLKSDTGYHRSREINDDTTIKKGNRRRSSSGSKSKRSSIPSISLSNTKSIIAGRFGDAFRRFESNPERNNEHENLNVPLSPITASEKNNSDDENESIQSRSHQFSNEPSSIDARFESGASNVLSEDEASLSPEVRREIERQRLAQEERRVAQKAAEHRANISNPTDKNQNGNKASSIQNRVRSLLNSNDKPKIVARTAEGYGRFTDDGKTSPQPNTNITSALSSPPNASSSSSSLHSPITSMTPSTPSSINFAVNKTQSQNAPIRSPINTKFDKSLPKIRSNQIQSQNTVVQAVRTGPRVAPKPMALRTNTPPIVSNEMSRGPVATISTHEQILVARARTGAGAGAATGTGLEIENNNDDWETDFAKRYPSLSGIEMVEREIEAKGPISGL